MFKRNEGILDRILRVALGWYFFRQWSSKP
jgi:hypothetical protein